MLPVLLGRATRLVDLVQSDRKSYHAIVSLGSATSTDDAEGEVTASMPVPRLTPLDVDAALHAFRGEILQVPPQYSAIKVNGQRAYAAARRGEEVALTPRRVMIHDVRATLLEPAMLQLDVTCESGTYIRALARDLATALGTVGHLTRLVRLSVGPFALDDALSVDEVEARGVTSTLQPASAVLPRAPEVGVTVEHAERLRNSAAVPSGVAAVDAVWVYDPRRTLVCLGSSDGTLLRSRVLL